jgi:benzylsuccinate CoA-transferase BbsE subunit
MDSQNKTQAMLEPYRALDLTDEKGYICGKILGDLGCDVIKIEKPGGDKGRSLGPFYKDILHPEKSLYWFAFNTSKRGITLDIETDDGRKIFKQLVKSADFVIESFPLGYMDSIGLGYSELSQVNEKIIVASITPFGPEGPYRDYKGSDIVGMALGGLMYPSGDPDRPPVTFSFPNAYFLSASEAAVGLLMALHWRWTTGRGTQVNTNLQTSVLEASYEVPLWWQANKFIIKRTGPISQGIIKYRQIWQCKDGYLSFFFYGGLMGAAGNRAIVEWMDSEGFNCEHLKSIDWDSLDWSAVTQEEATRMEEPLYDFFMSHTKAEFYEEAVKRDIILYPLSTIGDILVNPQLIAREYWAEVEHPELDTSITYPSAFAKASETPCRISRRAPLIGEHNREIYEEELGFSRHEMSILKEANTI